MGASLIGRKIGMSQIFDDNGQAVPVTVIELGPCVVTDIKTDTVRPSDNPLKFKL